MSDGNKREWGGLGQEEERSRSDGWWVLHSEAAEFYFRQRSK